MNDLGRGGGGDEELVDELGKWPGGRIDEKAGR